MRITPEDFARLYAGFQAPITALDCGQKCAPYNEGGVPFCCDTRHAVPTAYQAEWTYLCTHTDLWHRWQADDPAETHRLEAETPPHMVLIECQGADHCQRNFRAIACRAFPFFPYFNSAGEFLGLSVYWEYADRCWVISNLHMVSTVYRQQFIETFERLFDLLPNERITFQHHSAVMREHFIRKRRRIPLLHRNGKAYLISPRSEKMQRVAPDRLPKHGVYAITAALPFPDEVAEEIEVSEVPEVSNEPEVSEVARVPEPPHQPPKQ